MAIQYQWHLEYIIMYEKFGVIISRKSKNDRQYNGQKIKDKKTNNDQENTPQKTKDWSTRNPQKQEVNWGAPEGLLVPAPQKQEVNWGAPEGLLVTAPQKQEVNGGVCNFLYRSWQQMFLHNLRKIGLLVSVDIINNIYKLIVCLFNNVFGCQASKTRQLLFSLLCCLSPLFV
jgi:hypothetical protein